MAAAMRWSDATAPAGRATIPAQRRAWLSKSQAAYASRGRQRPRLQLRLTVRHTVHIPYLF